jgi:hypothetical protein
LEQNVKQSSKLRVDPRRRSFVRLIGEIRHALNQALVEEHEKRGLTRSKIADILGVNKSLVTRRLAGTSNMTLETLADLAYALDRPVKVTMPSRSLPAQSNQYVAPPPVASQVPDLPPELLIKNPSTNAGSSRVMAF